MYIYIYSKRVIRYARSWNNVLKHGSQKTKIWKTENLQRWNGCRSTAPFSACFWSGEISQRFLTELWCSCWNLQSYDFQLTLSSGISFVLLRLGPPHPQKGWEGGPKRNIGCKTGGEVLILFWPTSTSPLRWEWQWTNVKWNGIVNVECLHWLLSWKVVQENLQPLKLTNSLEQNWKFQNEVCWFQKPLLYSKKHLREKK